VLHFTLSEIDAMDWPELMRWHTRALRIRRGGEAT
jgi:hypothetical protein